MNKKLTQSGINGTFSGVVSIQFNHRKEEKTVQNPSTHDDYKKLFSYHRVIAKVEDDIIFASPEFINENDVWKYIDQAEDKVFTKLKSLATDSKRETTKDKLISRGYTE